MFNNYLQQSKLLITVDNTNLLKILPVIQSIEAGINKLRCRINKSNDLKNHLPAQKSTTTTLSRKGVNKAPNAL